nr:DciA family protein [Micromonospora sp. DSM 115978]
MPNESSRDRAPRRSASAVPPDTDPAGGVPDAAGGTGASRSTASSRSTGAVDGASGTASAGGAGPAAGGAEPAGPQLARAVLDAALARRQAGRPARRTPEGAGPDGGAEPGVAGGPAGARDGRPRRRMRGYSGPGPDPRDPQLLGAVLDRLVKARGWQTPAAEATVFGAWERVVGPEVAKHSRPVKLDAGELTVEAESTAWATQLRLLAGSLLQRIAAEVGHNVVRKLHIHGPSAPSWSRGPRRVRGRGPRDTYG